MCKNFRQQGIMFLDSGGYETSRMGKYGAGQEWTIEGFLGVADPDLFDIAFSFDLFPEPSKQTCAQYAESLEDLLDAHQPRITGEKLIPVVHLATKEGKTRFPDTDAVALVQYIAESRYSILVRLAKISLPDLRRLGSTLLTMRSHLIAIYFFLLSPPALPTTTDAQQWPMGS